MSIQIQLEQLQHTMHMEQFRNYFNVLNKIKQILPSQTTDQIHQSIQVSCVRISPKHSKLIALINYCILTQINYSVTYLMIQSAVIQQLRHSECSNFDSKHPFSPSSSRRFFKDDQIKVIYNVLLCAAQIRVARPSYIA